VTNFVRNLNKSNKTMLMHHNISVNLMFFLISLSFTLVRSLHCESKNWTEKDL